MLYLVATPIGNLADVTARAEETLGQVSFIICEDTRHTSVLLRHLGVRRPLVSLPAHEEAQRAAALAERLASGETAALVTDAGSPAISDPGERLVKEAIARGVTVSSVPGPSALIAALSASGLPTSRFHFLGFLPRVAADRVAMLEEVSSLRASLVLYESPRRVVDTLGDIAEVLGDRQACVARELTKVHEELLRGSLSELAALLRAREVLGEVVIIVAGRAPEERWTEALVLEALAAGLQRGEKLKALSKDLARRAGWSGGDVYKLGLRLK